MPIYEYFCEDCHKKSSFLLLRVSEEIDPFCKACGGKRLKRLISRVSIPKSEEKRMEGLLDPSKFSDLDENDPKSIEKIMKKMGRELGDDFEQSMEEALHESQSTSEGEL